LSTHDAMRDRFAATADRIAALQEQRADELAEQVRSFVSPTGEERALDVGAGTGALAFALAPLVREVVAVELVPELIELGRKNAPSNVSFVEGDMTKLDFERATFDLAGTLRTLHHVLRPELVIAELTRVTRPGGTMLVVDQIAPNDPLAANEPFPHARAGRCRPAAVVRVERPRAREGRVHTGGPRARPVSRPCGLRRRGARAGPCARAAGLHGRARLVPASAAVAEAFASRQPQSRGYDAARARRDLLLPGLKRLRRTSRESRG